MCLWIDTYLNLLTVPTLERLLELAPGLKLPPAVHRTLVQEQGSRSLVRTRLACSAVVPALAQDCLAMEFSKTMMTPANASVDEWGDANMDPDEYLKRKTPTPLRNQAASSHSLIRELDILKQVANLSQKVRLINSVMTWTLMMPAQLLAPAIQAAKDFGQSTRGIKNHGRGSPHPMVWRIVLTNMLGQAHKAVESLNPPDKDHLKQATVILDKYLQSFTACGPKKAYMFVRQATVRTTRADDKSILKFEVSSLLENSRDVQLAIIFVAEHIGGSVLEGTEAPTDLERKLQQHIDTLKGKVEASDK